MTVIENRTDYEKAALTHRSRAWFTELRMNCRR